jgi:hypothetical protein
LFVLKSISLSLLYANEEQRKTYFAFYHVMIDITSNGNVSSFIGQCSDFETNATSIKERKKK